MGVAVSRVEKMRRRHRNGVTGVRRDVQRGGAPDDLRLIMADFIRETRRNGDLRISIRNFFGIQPKRRIVGGCRSGNAAFHVPADGRGLAASA